MGTIVYPKLWDWKDSDLHPLSEWSKAPDSLGFYELGQLATDGLFLQRYCGRAAGTTLRMRLSKHFRNSHNAKIKRHRNSLYFRCRAFQTAEEARFVEAVHISALADKKTYDWNDREEWNQHFAIEDANAR